MGRRVPPITQAVKPPAGWSVKGVCWQALGGAARCYRGPKGEG